MEDNILNLNAERKIDSVEKFKFEPIKGYPMLRWKGKRPFTSTQYYPAQLKEQHGEETDGWINQIFWGDNLQVMSHLLKKYRGQVDLIYIDPPYDSKADYKKKISLKGQSVENDNTAFEEKQYTDIWSNDEYLQFMYERIMILKELLAENGSIYIHMDEKRGHFIKIILDEIFGSSNFKREIIWSTKTSSGFKTSAYNWIRTHDILYFYTKTPEYKFNKQYWDYTEEYKKRFHRVDEQGRKYRDDRSNGEKQYLDELKGIAMGDVWDDIMSFQQAATSNEIQGYPTQKPETLLERIIKASTKEGDLVFDCFMGSGTTQAVAMKLGRRFIGADINLGAVQTTTKRLIKVANELNSQQNKIGFDDENKIENYYTGFQVYNVNNYDVFRNPIEAKDLLLKALEVQPMPNSMLYDGEKDGRFVKVMPVNRIATRADLNELIVNFDYKTFEKRHNESPNKPVEAILLVCMGHEPDLAAHLKEQVPFPLDVKIVDVLRDKSNLEFKHDSDAEISIEGNRLLVREFYPMNLLQKLSIQKENVENWKEMTESIMIDFNYDGSIFEPQIVDIPEKNELVKGVYDIPKDSGTIHIKITDLLSETFEKTIK
ncbi:site-specific DNA-methyltransferase [Apibacter sp. B2912]|uniref:site-specific DNA-methyltransferase n=1 Tax=Apibacter sp. B2912 TaxID=2656763 RepID=UPI00136927F7|nr:site-specific DNA-methyltransferase [Apibacter sp. B2912]MXO32677.1 site-specific DNA-methyltransferase [Apibacter sp. B2912]